MFTSFVLVALTSFYLLTKRRYRWFYIIYKTFKRDVRAFSRFTLLNFNLWRYERCNTTVAKIFTKLAQKHPEKIAFYFEDQQWSFDKVEEFSNRIAHFFKSEGYKRGDSIALLFDSSPEYACIWLGLSKIGVVTALINSNLVSEPLIHSLTVSNAKAVIFGSNFNNVVKDIQDKISKLSLYQYGKSGSEEKLGADLGGELKKQPCHSLVEDLEAGKFRDRLVFIYTSGTTGLPKAAVITNLRFIFMADGVHYMSALRQDDVLYDSLPLYHSAGGILGIGQCFLRGITVVIRKKFSASNFWSDCVKYNCTVAQYIGEICRYILAAHAKDPKTVEHNVRTIVGNGLRPLIWKQFVSKFNIKEIYEFYGATEGNSNLINTDNKVGAVGFVPRYAWKIYPVTLVRCNEATGEPIRNEKGFCTRCRPGELGVFIGVINPKKSINDFAGYADKKATAGKIIDNVFKKGDIYFNSGDILVQDELGYFYFKDRTGDTFRWKGENVATSEIEAVISNVADLKDAVVYGVEVPGNEGRAGMVAMVDTNNSLDLEKLAKGLKASLPTYAVPIFMRVMQSVPLTGTFKLKKVELQEEGFNLDRVKDRLFIYDSKNVTYVKLTREKYEDIMTGQTRL